MHSIQDGRSPHLAAQLSITAPSSWRYAHAIELGKIPDAIERLVVHYDLYTQWREHIGFTHLSETIRIAKQTVVATVCASPRTLSRRIKMRFGRRLATIATSPSRTRHNIRSLGRLWRKCKFYRDSNNVIGLYQQWFREIERYDLSQHWLLDANRAIPSAGIPYGRRHAELLIR